MTIEIGPNLSKVLPMAFFCIAMIAIAAINCGRYFSFKKGDAEISIKPEKDEEQKS